MKILEVFGEPVSTGGQEAFVINNVMQNIDYDGIVIDVFTPYYSDNKQYEKIVKDKGGKIYCGGLNFEPGKSRKNIIAPIEKLILQNGYDVVHVHSGSISVLAYTAKVAKKCGVKKVIVHSHCGVEKITLKNRLLRNLMSFTMKKNVDVYCACSKVAGEAKFCDSVVKKRLHVIKNGIDLEKYKFNNVVREQIRNKYHINSDSLVIGHVGRFSYQKNHEYLLDVFYNVINKKDNAILMLVGDGELKDSIIKKIKSLKIEDKVILCGNINNVQDYIQSFDVFVLPSRYEGLPIVGVEAQASGLKTIVSTNVSSELKLTDSIEYISLNENEKWVDAILKVNVGQRFDNTESLRSAGFDIAQTAQIVRNMYM